MLDVYNSEAFCFLDHCVSALCHRSPLFTLKVGDPPLPGRLTPQISVCVALLSAPPRRTIIPPPPTCTDRRRVRWGVLDLLSIAGWRETGSDQIRTDSHWVCVSPGAGRSFRYQRGFWGDFIFPTKIAKNLTTPYFIWASSGSGIFSYPGFYSYNHLQVQIKTCDLQFVHCRFYGETSI